MVSSAGPASGAPQSTFRFFLQELKPKGRFLTPFNIISIPVILRGLVLTVIRFTQGLGSVTNLNQQFPWGFWIGFDVVCGVAFAAGAYVITFVVYVMNAKKYHPIVRITVLNGFLAYVFYAGALTLDLGRPWKIVNPIIGNSYGYSSVLFLVAWHFMLYMITAMVEFAPAIAEWLGMRRVRRVLNAMTVGAVIFGITLSMLHQSGMSKAPRGQAGGMDAMRYGGTAEAIYVLEVFRRSQDLKLEEDERQRWSKTLTVNVAKNKRPPSRTGIVDLYIDPDSVLIRKLQPADLSSRARIEVPDDADPAEAAQLMLEDLES